MRKTMVSEAVWLVRKRGFDGVQWDYEICPDADSGFLLLLKETRAALPSGAILGAAVPMWMPVPFSRWGWSDEYPGKVAARCDQMAVMCYDSGFWLPRSYAWLVHRRAIHATQAASARNPRCRILLGLPTYGAAGLSHNPRAENVRNALKGAREGFADSQCKRDTLAGAALFADYTTDSDEWSTWDSLWLNH